ncbi:kinase domain protein [Ostertagia ostertagi]
MHLLIFFSKIIQLVEHFDYHGHCCLVFKLYGLSVFDFQRKYNFRPYHIEDTRHIMYQICYAVKFLHDNKLTHTDLKPENVLFVCDDCYTEKVGNLTFHRPKNTNVRLIDLGSATFNNEHHSAIISTRHYRAPEVILDLGWWQPCDTWSLGCILYELHRGATLFRTHSNREHLAMMERVCGHIPLRMIRKTRTKYFHNDVLDVTGTDESFIRDTCANLVLSDKTLSLKRKIEDSDVEERELFELMHSMMQFEPAARITMADALQSPFFARIPENKRIPGIHPPNPTRRPGIMDPLYRGARGRTGEIPEEGEAD